MQALSNELLEICMMQHLPAKDALKLALCNKELVKKAELLKSILKCTGVSHVVGTALERVVNRPVLVTAPRCSGGFFTSWMYSVEEERDGLHVWGQFQLNGQGVMLKVIPHYNAKQAEYGWYEVCSAYPTWQCLQRGKYAEPDAVDELLLRFRTPITDPKAEEEQRLADQEAFQNIRELMEEEMERARADWDAFGYDAADE